MKALIVYFSRNGENYVSGRLTQLSVGNTKIVAEIIQNTTSADVFEIKMKHSYSKDYMTCIQEAKKDLQEQARPEIVSYLDSIDEYNLIYLGYPNYWGTYPMAVATFLEHYDFTGKIIKPFCTHEGSGMGTSEADLKKICSGAVIKRGMDIHGGSVERFEKQIVQWAK